MMLRETRILLLDQLIKLCSSHSHKHFLVHLFASVLWRFSFGEQSLLKFTLFTNNLPGSLQIEEREIFYILWGFRIMIKNHYMDDVILHDDFPATFGVDCGQWFLSTFSQNFQLSQL